jgi:hypothetical protein
MQPQWPTWCNFELNLDLHLKKIGLSVLCKESIVGKRYATLRLWAVRQKDGAIAKLVAEICCRAATWIHR